MRDQATNDKGAGRAAGEVEEEGGRRSHSTGETRDHPEESDAERSGEGGIRSTTNRTKAAEQKRAFEREVGGEIERRMHDLRLERRSHDKHGEHGETITR